MTREDYQYNKRIAREHSERSFPRKVKIMIGTGILIGLLTALTLFIMTVRATEEMVRQFNNY